MQETSAAARVINIPSGPQVREAALVKGMRAECDRLSEELRNIHAESRTIAPALERARYLDGDVKRIVIQGYAKKIADRTAELEDIKTNLRGFGYEM